ncbi:MAG: hypothetical protein AAF542_13380 [Pseudomonadota bacterium]
MLHGYICDNTTVTENQAMSGISKWLAQHSELSPLLTDFQRSFSGLPQLPPSVLPLCKIRMAQLHRAKVDNNTSVEFEELAKAVAHWPDHEQFTLLEKACLAFTEVYAMDVHAITDAQSDAVKQTVGEPGLVALVQALGVFYAETRLATLWGLAECSEQAEHAQ